MDWKELFGSDDESMSEVGDDVNYSNSDINTSVLNDGDNDPLSPGNSDNDNRDSDNAIPFADQKQPILSFDDIPGLYLIRKALDHNEQMKMTHEIINQGYFSGDNNQAMCFGELPSYINWINDLVIDKYGSLFNPEILNREPLFDQAILNLYKKGQGICSHVDLLRFEDGILILSLLSSCVMTMKRASDNFTKNILLCPGDILSLSHDARYLWEHGIEEQLYDHIDNQTIERGTRISVTLRKFKPGSMDTTMETTATRY